MFLITLFKVLFYTLKVKVYQQTIIFSMDIVILAVFAGYWYCIVSILYQKVLYIKIFDITHH